MEVPGMDVECNRDIMRPRSMTSRRHLAPPSRFSCLISSAAQATPIAGRHKQLNHC